MHSRQIAEMISSRICHDLISPVGAISNGVELMLDMNKTSPEIELIGQSAANAKGKLMFFRIAFGASGPDSMVGYAASTSLIENMFLDGRMSVQFPQPWGDRSKSLVKLLFLLILCVDSSLPRGGVIECTPTDSGWKLAVTNSRIDPQKDLWQATLQGDPFGQLSTNQIQFQLARDAAEAIDIKIAAEFGDQTLTLIF